MRRWIRWLSMAAGFLPALVSANPFAALPVLPSGEISATGKTIITLENGDYSHPHFSPDSRYLAFSHELPEGPAELSEIQVLDIKTRQVMTLLDAKASRDFAVYKNMITGFFWKNATTLQASISDGDVSGVDLIYDVTSGKLVEKKPISFNEGASDREGARIAGMEKAFPSIPTPVLANALANGFKVGDGKYVAQKNYYQQDNHIWYLDAARQEIVKLVDIPEAWIYSLRGAFAYGKDFVLLVAYNQDAYLVRYHDKRLELLQRLPVKNYQQTGLRVEHARGNRVLFQVITSPSYEKRENYLFVYDQAGLRKIRDVTSIDDLDIDGAGKLACFSLWHGDKRRLVLKELKDFR